MIIAVMSDSHDNIWRLDAAMDQMNEAELLIHCGDLCSPFVIHHIGKAARGRPIHVVWGNNEGDIRLICEVASRYQNVHLQGDFAELEIEGLRVAVNHYPEIALSLAASGRYDLVCYGHDHQARKQKVGDCLLLNPGELMGMKGQATFALFDTETRDASFVELP
ncbi:MAG TPA: metallophosphoesterase [Acidobacteriota bacterium]|nr:metallophosphoesterase [Acidobacteriota bacterium]